MGAHLLHPDFLRFLDALSAGPADPWQVYEDLYVGPHRAALEAWWDQCIGRPRSAWQDRVRSVRPQDYGLLREVVREADLEEMARDSLSRCQAIAPLSPAPAVYYLVGFFSPEGFAFRVEGRWAIGIGMERLGSLHLVPILLTHEYGHCYRRSLADPQTLGERLVDEGFAVALSARAFPDRPPHEHLLMRPGQLAALRQYGPRLHQAVEPLLSSTSDDLARRIIYGRGPAREFPSRAGVYIGWRMVHESLVSGRLGFDAPADRVLAAARSGSQSEEAGHGPRRSPR